MILLNKICQYERVFVTDFIFSPKSEEKIKSFAEEPECW